MSKWYEVEVQTLVVYAVEVEDDENEGHAINEALDQAPLTGRSSGSTLPLPAAHLAMIRKNADVVLSLDGEWSTEDEDE